MIQTLTSTDELLARRPADVYLHAEIAPGRTDLPAWASDDAVCFLGQRQPGRPRLVGLGEPAALARLVTGVLDALPTPPPAFTMERAAYGLLPPRLHGGETDDWDFQYIAVPPPDTPGEQSVGWLDGAAADITELLVAASPRHDVKPGEPQVRRWAGLRGPDGTLLACAADTRRVSTMTALLASIATAPAARRQGFGAAVTAWLTRRILAEGDPVCTLGLYADNEPAKRLYRRLGYQHGHHFTSGQFGAGTNGQGPAAGG